MDNANSYYIIVCLIRFDLRFCCLFVCFLIYIDLIWSMMITINLDTFIVQQQQIHIHESKHTHTAHTHTTCGWPIQRIWWWPCGKTNIDNSFSFRKNFFFISIHKFDNWLIMNYVLMDTMETIQENKTEKISMKIHLFYSWERISKFIYSTTTTTTKKAFFWP